LPRHAQLKVPNFQRIEQSLALVSLQASSTASADATDICGLTALLAPRPCTLVSKYVMTPCNLELAARCLSSPRCACAQLALRLLTDGTMLFSHRQRSERYLALQVLQYTHSAGILQCYQVHRHTSLPLDQYVYMHSPHLRRAADHLAMPAVLHSGAGRSDDGVNRSDMHSLRRSRQVAIGEHSWHGSPSCVHCCFMEVPFL
jgi:hypothetical protein